MIAFIVLVIGGLNWLLLGLFQWEVGALFGGSAALISRAIYIIVGLAALAELLTHKTNCKACAAKAGSMGGQMNMPSSQGSM